MTERIVWVVAVALVGGAAFFGGRQVGFDAGQQSRAQAAQRFFNERGGQGGGGVPGQPGQGAPGLPGGQGVTGLVERVEGDRIVIATPNGTSVTVHLAANVQVRKQVDGQLSDVTVGERIVAIGTRNGDTVEATAVQIGGAFGGGRGGP